MSAGPAPRRLPAWARKLAWGLGALLLSVVAGLAWLNWQLAHPPAMAPYQDLVWTQVPGTPSGLRVRFAGVSTLVLDDGETAVMTDGFFSRHDRLTALVGQVAPDLPAIDAGLQRLGLAGQPGRLAAVIPVHSHYDHAMDAPAVAQRSGALLVGSASTANIGRGWGLPEARIRTPRMGEAMQFGRFTVTLWPSRHAPTGFTGGSIDAPLRPPARAMAYREGQSYAVHIRHGSHSLLVNGSAGFEPGALQKAGVRADVVLLGIGSLGTQNEAYRRAYWENTVSATGARRVLAIHWDDFWQPAGSVWQPMPPPLDRFDLSMDFLRTQARAAQVGLFLPLPWEPMDLWAGLDKPR